MSIIQQKRPETNFIGRVKLFDIEITLESQFETSYQANCQEPIHKAVRILEVERADADAVAEGYESIDVMGTAGSQPSIWKECVWIAEESRCGGTNIDHEMLLAREDLFSPSRCIAYIGQAIVV